MRTPQHWRRAWAVVVIMVAGCATTPPPPLPEPIPRSPDPLHALTPAPVSCPCDEPIREAARLRHDLANKENELRDLRAEYRDQVKSLQESLRQSNRAKVKLRRL